jgi:hypothetical protein
MYRGPVKSQQQTPLLPIDRRGIFDRGPRGSIILRRRLTAAPQTACGSRLPQYLSVCACWIGNRPSGSCGLRSSFRERQASASDWSRQRLPTRPDPSGRVVAYREIGRTSLALTFGVADHIFGVLILAKPNETAVTKVTDLRFILHLFLDWQTIFPTSRFVWSISLRP